MSGIISFLFTIILGCFLVFLWNQRRTIGKILVLFLEGDKYVRVCLLPVRGDFVMDFKTGEAYYIFPERVRLIRFPIGWPSILSFMQQIVPCVEYVRGDGEPLNWNKPAERTVSSKEVGAAMEPEWLSNLVRGYREAEGGGSKWQRMLPVLGLGIGLITLILIFVVMTKVGGLQNAVDRLKEAGKLGVK